MESAINCITPNLIPCRQASLGWRRPVLLRGIAVAEPEQAGGAQLLQAAELRTTAPLWAVVTGRDYDAVLAAPRVSGARTAGGDWRLEGLLQARCRGFFHFGCMQADGIVTPWARLASTVSLHKGEKGRPPVQRCLQRYSGMREPPDCHTTALERSEVARAGVGERRAARAARAACGLFGVSRQGTGASTCGRGACGGAALHSGGGAGQRTRVCGGWGCAQPAAGAVRGPPRAL